MVPKIEKILEGFKLSEGPHWDHENQCLYFVDIATNTIHKYVPGSKKHTQTKIDNHTVTIVIPVKNRKNEFFITLDRSVALIEWDGESKEVASIKKLYTVDEGTTHVFNDGKCDKTGRLWSGTRSQAAATAIGTLYSFSQNTVKNHRNNIGMPNGIAFDYVRGKMYYIDTYSHGIDQYDIDFETGIISNQQTIFKTSDKACDGMTIDTDGNLWVAIFGGAAVYQIDPRKGVIIQVVELPADQITSVAFGGPNLDELYVTSAAIKNIPLGESPGSVFRVTGLNVKGFSADEAVI